MSYEGGGAVQGPTGPTGPTGPSGGDFSGPTGAILWYDGSGITGTTGFSWTETGGIGDNAYILTAGLNGNYINMDAPGSMQMAINQLGVGNTITISGGSTVVSLIDQVTGGTPGSLQVSINGINGASGQYLGSDGNQNVVWSTPPTSSGPTGATGATGPTGPTGPTGGAILSGLAEITTVLSTEYYIALPFTPTLTQNAVIQTTLQVQDGLTQNWIVYAEPNFGIGGSQFIHVNFAAPVVNVGTTIAWAVIATDCTPSNPTTSLPV